MLPPSAMHYLDLLWKTPLFVKMGAGIAAYGWVRQWWQQRQQRLLSEASKGWPTHRARVVAVQAVREGREGEKKGLWSGLLTYSYLIDEIEIGEYRQSFSSEDEVDEWVRSLREKTVTIAVDPLDKRRSIWIANEAAAAREAASRSSLTSEPLPLAIWVEVVRLGTFWVAVCGTVLSMWLEVTELTGVHINVPILHIVAPAVLAGGAIGCFAVATYVFTKRFPGRSMGAIADQFRDPAVKFFLKALGFIEGSTVFWLWLHLGAGDTVMRELAPRAIFSAAWGGLFAGAATALWVAGKRPPVKHELEPGF